MELIEIIKKIGNVSKKEIKQVAPTDPKAIKEIILRCDPADVYEKMVLGYLTSLCAEYMHPVRLSIEKDNLDYIGFELEMGTIEIGTAGNKLGTCMKGGKIMAKKAGDETGASMTGGELIADEIKSIGNTIGGKIITQKVDNISRTQGAEIFINGERYKRSFLDRLLGR